MPISGAPLLVFPAGLDDLLVCFFVDIFHGLLVPLRGLKYVEASPLLSD
jgi:hypothetical protein